MKKIFLFYAILIVTVTARAQDFYCHSWLWGGELNFQATSSDLKALANEIVDQCRDSIGAADFAECKPHLTCCRVSPQGVFESSVDVQDLIKN